MILSLDTRVALICCFVVLCIISCFYVSSKQPTYNHNCNKQKSTLAYHSEHHSYHSEKTLLHYAHTFHNEPFDSGGELDHHSPQMGRCVGHSPLLFSKRFCKLIDRLQLRCSDRDGMHIGVYALLDFPIILGVDGSIIVFIV